MKKVLLFGGSFDPVHNAHITLCEKACKMLYVDKCYMILSKNPVWKNPNSTAKDRLNMLKLGLKGHKNIKISLIEYKSKSEDNFTYNTIKKMKKFNKNKYYYLIGSDQLDVLHKWYRIDELSKLVQFVVFRRANYPLNIENMEAYSCQLLESEEYDISSTKVRYLNDLDCPKAVLDYIEKKKLFYYSILKNYLSEKRINHSFEVARLSYDIAKNNGVNPIKAYHAGLIHDIAKDIKVDEAKSLMTKNFKTEIENIKEWGYHQFLGTSIAKNIFKIDDTEIIDAIMFHASGKKEMSKLGKIIYAADKIEPSRGWNSKEFIKMCIADINKGFIEVLRANIEYFKEKNIDYSNKYTLECIEYYL